MVPPECPAGLELDHVESVKRWLTIDPTGTVIAVNPATFSSTRTTFGPRPAMAAGSNARAAYPSPAPSHERTASTSKPRRSVTVGT